MKIINLVFVSVLVMVLVLSSISEASNADQKQHYTANYSPADQDHNDDVVGDATLNSLYSSAQGRWFSPKKRSRRVTCNKFPGICHAKGSPGPTCCKKKCVNILTDRQNCGRCGKKCKYNEICCKGKCVNPSFNRKHCGGCNNRCGNGDFCVFGLCNYA